MSTIHLNDRERAALTFVRARAMQEERSVSAQFRDALPVIVSRPGPMLFDDIPPWMYAMSADEIVMAVPKAPGWVRLTILALSCAVGAAFWWRLLTWLLPMIGRLLHG